MPTYKKILCPIDFGRLSQRALAHAAELAQQMQAELSLVHVHVLGVVSLSMGEIAPNAAKMVEDSSELQERLNRALEEVAPALPRADTHLLVADSSIADTILGHANNDGTDIIVVGGHGRSQVEELFLGSVANELIRKASCPVLVIPDREDG